jgi:hypothetical protein
MEVGDTVPTDEQDGTKRPLKIKRGNVVYAFLASCCHPYPYPHLQNALPKIGRPWEVSGY